MTDVTSGETYEEAVLACCYHWASQPGFHSVLHGDLDHSFAVPIAARSMGSGVLAFPTGALGELEERLKQGTMRLSDMLEWTGRSDVFWEVAFMEFPADSGTT